MPVYRRPAAYALNPQHPLADAAWMVVGDPRKNVDVVGGLKPTFNTNGSYGLSRLGKAFVSSSNGGGSVEWSFPTRVGQIERSISIAILADLTDYAAYGKLICVPYLDGTWNSPFASVAFGRSVSTSAVQFEFADTSNNHNTCISDSNFFDLTGRVRLYGVSRSAADVTFWRDGTVFSQHPSAVSTLAINWNAFASVYLMDRSRNLSAEGVTGAVVFAAIWPRALSAAEWSLLYRDPFSLFAYGNLGAAPPVSKRLLLLGVG